MFRRNGFTLIELIIVIVIIGILASIVAPMMSGMKAKTICAEAVTGIATLRTAFISYRLEYQTYPIIPQYRWLSNPSFALDINTLKALGLEGAALDGFNGRYFSNNCYMFYSSGTGLYIYVFTDPAMWGSYGATANTSPGGTPPYGNGETQNIVDNKATYGLIYVYDTLTAKGKFTQYNIKRSGY